MRASLRPGSGGDPKLAPRNRLLPKGPGHSNVKRCSYCGKENEADRERCFVCGTTIPAATAGSAAADETAGATGPRDAERAHLDAAPGFCFYCGKVNAADAKCCERCQSQLPPEPPDGDQFTVEPDAPDVSEFPLSFQTENGFSYPDWDAVWGVARARYQEAGYELLYRQLARVWLRQLKADLGGAYFAYESQNFLLLCAAGRDISHKLLESAEQYLDRIVQALQFLAPPPALGKRLILIFHDADDYYAYISHFYAEGTHGYSSGCFFQTSYMHIAIQMQDLLSAQHTLAHELLHNCMYHLDIPAWLNEGLAQAIERSLTHRPYRLDHDMMDRHRTFWNSQNIQEFWLGKSFHDPQANELAYDLSEVLVQLLGQDWESLLGFAEKADWRDGGQDAALRTLGKCLGETVGGLLGEGNWRPNRRAIAALAHEKANSESSAEAGTQS